LGCLKVAIVVHLARADEAAWWEKLASAHFHFGALIRGVQATLRLAQEMLAEPLLQGHEAGLNVMSSCSHARAVAFFFSIEHAVRLLIVDLAVVSVPAVGCKPCGLDSGGARGGGVLRCGRDGHDSCHDGG